MKDLSVEECIFSKDYKTLISVREVQQWNSKSQNIKDLRKCSFGEKNYKVRMAADFLLLSLKTFKKLKEEEKQFLQEETIISARNSAQ